MGRTVDNKEKRTELTENSVRKNALLNQAAFLKKFQISPKAFQSTNIQWTTLEKIHVDYVSNEGLLQDLLNRITGKFLTGDAKDAGVHSVRSRLKSPDGLIEKIIRKTIEAQKKGENLNITVKNYHNAITDLIGIRVLHTFKDDWFGIHNYILGQCKYTTIESPVVYYRKGDQRHFINQCKKNGCNAKAHPKGYRSIHYIIDPHPSKQICYIEIQVRTVFEDGWSEIDHKLRYISKKGDKHALDNYLLALNRIAGSADEIGSLIKNREIELRQEEYQKQVKNKSDKS